VVRFVAAGGGSLVVDLALQWGLLTALGLPFWLGSALSYELALIGHFLVNNRWVFGHESVSFTRFGQFQLTALTAMAITWGVSNALVYGPGGAMFAEGVGPYLAKIAGTGTAFLWTFFSSFFWIWKPKGTAVDMAAGSAEVNSAAAREGTGA
jgi:putative flippase GtrA